MRAIEINPSKNFSLRFAYDYNKRQEMKMIEKGGIVGFSFGFGIKLKKLNKGCQPPKNKILTKLVPEVSLRKKTHGFENLLSFNHEAYRQLANTQTLRLESSLDGIEFNNTVDQLRKFL